MWNSSALFSAGTIIVTYVSSCPRKVDGTSLQAVYCKCRDIEPSVQALQDLKYVGCGCFVDVGKNVGRQSHFVRRRRDVLL